MESAAAEAGKADAGKADDPKGIDFFEKKIRPVLVANCYQCHSASAKELKGELRLDTREGHSQGGRERARPSCPASPTRACSSRPCGTKTAWRCRPRRSCPTSVIADFAKWIEMGAPDPRKPNVTTVGGKINIVEARKFWSFQPPKVVAAAGREERRLAEDRHRPLSARGAGSEEACARSPTPTAARSSAGPTSI